MVCEDKITLISTHIDGETAGEEETAIKAHIAACEGCRDYARRLARLKKSVGTLGRMELSNTGMQDLMAAVNVRLNLAPPAKRESRLLRWFGKPALGWAVASAGAAVFALVIWSSPINNGTQDMRPLMPTLEKTSQDETDNKMIAPPAARDALGETFTRERLNEMVKGGQSSEKQSFDQGTDAAAPSEKKEAAEQRAQKPGPNAIGSDQAFNIVADNRPATLVSAVSGTFENRSAWIVLLRFRDNQGGAMAAAVAFDGTVLYTAK